MSASLYDETPEERGKTFYQPHVRVKVLQRTGDPTSWSQGNLASMELLVVGPKIEVAIKWRLLSRVLGCTWIFDAPWTRLEVISMPSPYWRPREWIVLRTRAKPSRSEMLAISEDGAMNQIWTALLDAGAIPISDGPA